MEANITKTFFNKFLVKKLEFSPEIYAVYILYARYLQLGSWNGQWVIYAKYGDWVCKGYDQKKFS